MPQTTPARPNRAGSTELLQHLRTPTYTNRLLAGLRVSPDGRSSTQGWRDRSIGLRSCDFGSAGTADRGPFWIDHSLNPRAPSSVPAEAREGTRGQGRGEGRDGGEPGTGAVEPGATDEETGRQGGGGQKGRGVDAAREGGEGAEREEEAGRDQSPDILRSVLTEGSGGEVAARGARMELLNTLIVPSRSDGDRPPRHPSGDDRAEQEARAIGTLRRLAVGQAEEAEDTGRPLSRGRDNGREDQPRPRRETGRNTGPTTAPPGPRERSKTDSATDHATRQHHVADRITGQPGPYRGSLPQNKPRCEDDRQGERTQAGELGGTETNTTVEGTTRDAGTETRDKTSSQTKRLAATRTKRDKGQGTHAARTTEGRTPQAGTDRAVPDVVTKSHPRTAHPTEQPGPKEGSPPEKPYRCEEEERQKEMARTLANPEDLPDVASTQLSQKGILPWGAEGGDLQGFGGEGLEPLVVAAVPTSESSVAAHDEAQSTADASASQPRRGSAKPREPGAAKAQTRMEQRPGTGSRTDTTDQLTLAIVQGAAIAGKTNRNVVTADYELQAKEAIARFHAHVERRRKGQIGGGAGATPTVCAEWKKAVGWIMGQVRQVRGPDDRRAIGKRNGAPIVKMVWSNRREAPASLASLLEDQREGEYFDKYFNRFPRPTINDLPEAAAARKHPAAGCMCWKAAEPRKPHPDKATQGKTQRAGGTGTKRRKPTGKGRRKGSESSFAFSTETSSGSEWVGGTTTDSSTASESAVSLCTSLRADTGVGSKRARTRGRGGRPGGTRGTRSGSTRDREEQPTNHPDKHRRPESRERRSGAKVEGRTGKMNKSEHKDSKAENNHLGQAQTRPRPKPTPTPKHPHEKSTRCDAKQRDSGRRAQATRSRTTTCTKQGGGDTSPASSAPTSPSRP